MLKAKYINFLKQEARQFFPDQKVKIFIFGSAVERDNFRDVDVGIMGNFEAKQIYELQEIFEESTFPYLVDLVNFNQVRSDFKDFVLNQKVIWL